MRNLVFLMVLLFGCSDRIVVKVDYDRSMPVATRKTFKWLSTKEIESRNEPLIINEMNDKRIRTAVQAALVNAGYTPAEEAAEMIVHYHIVIEEKKAINPASYGYAYGPYWTDRHVDVYYYREGTIIIDVMDAANKQLLWRGWAYSVLGNEGYLTEEDLDESIERIFKKFPVQAAKPRS